MSAPVPSPPADAPRREDELVPRYRQQGYGEEDLRRRRAWVEEKTGARLEHVGASTIPGPEMRGNIENPIGAVQVPLGVVGPLSIVGEHARGTFYVPLATTEGAMLRSYERGMVALTRAGGVTTRVLRDENRICPVFTFSSVAEAHAFAASLPARVPELRAAAEATTRHGRLLAVEARLLGREVIVDFRFTTGDAHGMNLAVRATEAACRWLVEHTAAREYLIFSGMSLEKRPGGALFAGGKGKRVTAGATLPARTVRALLQTTPEAMARLWHRTVLGQLEAGATGYGGQVANGLTALFIATGQDVANVVNSAAGITHFEVVDGGDLFASVTLHALTVATVGGGTGLPTARECLAMLDCTGTGKARKLAEIAAAMVLAGEISMAAAIASGQFVAAHEQYGRNRPGRDSGVTPEEPREEGR